MKNSYGFVEEPEDGDLCAWCDENPIYRKGLCHGCYDAGLADEADRRYEELREQEMEEDYWDER